MAGPVAALRDADGRIKKRKDGTTIWRARYPDPNGKKPTDQIERRFRTEALAEAWVEDEANSIRTGDHVAPRDGMRLLRNRRGRVA